MASLKDVRGWAAAAALAAALAVALGLFARPAVPAEGAAGASPAQKIVRVNYGGDSYLLEGDETDRAADGKVLPRLLEQGWRVAAIHMAGTEAKGYGLAGLVLLERR